MSRLLAATTLVGVALLAGSCAQTGIEGNLSDTNDVPATASLADVERLAADAAEFAEDHLEAWPDVDAFVTGYTDDYRFADPTWSDFRVGSQSVISMLRAWESMTDYTIEVTDLYVSADGAAFEESWPGLQPPLPLPPDPPVASGLEVFTFQDGQVAGSDLWYRAEDNVAYGIGCFAVDGCPALQDTIDRYITAWSSGEPGAIADLYHPDASFSDSLLDLDAEGPDSIADVFARRFGSSEGLRVDVLDLYAWTAGTRPPTEASPDSGRLIGIAVHYRASIDGAEIHEAMATLTLGTRSDTGIDPDPRGLIHHEEVYHAP